MPLFQQSEGTTVYGGIFVDNSGFDNRKGIEILLEYVQREAIHGSNSRDDLGCHPGTREEYIRNITGWGSGEWESEKRAFLMTGPAGAGKSAIAWTCAHKIEAAGNLGASFFFFRPGGWNDPKKFIPTIVYQLTTRYTAYHDCLDALILADRLVLEKTMVIQFRELIVKPLRKLSAEGHSVGKDVAIIVDGLDECATVEAQVQIIHLVAASIHKRTTPFLWAFFSRPEPPITSAFSSAIATSTSWKLPLTLSGNAKSDIEAYLRGSFQVIRTKYNIPAEVAWPTEENIRHLVSQSAGLFVYAVTAIRYIGELGNGTSGLEERLRTVLELNSSLTQSPFFALDQLYTLVMMQIPQGVLPDTLSLLLFNQDIKMQPLISGPNFSVGMNPHDEGASYYCRALGLSPAAFHVAISNLHSVLREARDAPWFYHKSFPDFLLDPMRSKQYYIRSPGAHKHCLEMVVRNMASTVDKNDARRQTFQAFFYLVQKLDGKLEEDVLQQLSQVNWSLWNVLISNLYYEINFPLFIRKIPKDWRSRIIRPFLGARRRFDIPKSILYQTLAMLRPEQYKARGYILGKGDKKCLAWRSSANFWYFEASFR